MITKLTEWQSAMLEKLVGDEMIRARESGCPSDQINDLAMLMDTLETADGLHVVTFQRRAMATLTRRQESEPADDEGFLEIGEIAFRAEMTKSQSATAPKQISLSSSSRAASATLPTSPRTSRAQWPLGSATKSRSTATPISTDLSQSHPKGTEPMTRRGRSV